MFLLAIFLPPLAVLLCGKPFQAMLNVLLCCIFWVPGMLHALMLVSARNADRRNRALIDAVKQGPASG